MLRKRCCCVMMTQNTLHNTIYNGESARGCDKAQSIQYGLDFNVTLQSLIDVPFIFPLIRVQVIATTRQIVKKDWSVRFVTTMNQYLIVQALVSREKIIVFRTSQCHLQR